MKPILITAAVALLAGCAGAPVVTTVKVPVPVQCKETVPDRPVMPTEQFTKKPKVDEFTKAAQAEIERREGYEVKMRAALEACTAPLTP
jgi:type IV pilus biogenesis protein CpaD/CtpE